MDSTTDAEDSVDTTIADSNEDDSEMIERTIGADCESASDCTGVTNPYRVCLTGEATSDLGHWVGGYCSANCSLDLDCGPGAACADYDGGNCLKLCTEHDECREREGPSPYLCKEYPDFGPAMYCLPDA